MSIIYNGMDVHISTSFGEGFPNVVLEALATKISISINTGDSSNILNDDFLYLKKRITKQYIINYYIYMKKKKQLCEK